MTKRGQIENGQTTVAQADFHRPSGVLKDDRTGIVGPAMRQRASGSLQKVGSEAGVTRQDAYDAAHKILGDQFIIT